MNSPAHLSVTLHHLAPDARRAGPGFADVDLTNVAPERLRQMIESVIAMAPTTQFPAEPELRISGSHGRFLLQVRNGKVRLTSWTSQQTGSDFSAGQIFAIVTGTEPPAEGGGAAFEGVSATVGQLSQRWKVGLLAIVIAGVNAVTFWMLVRPPLPPPPELIPAYRLLQSEQSDRVLAEFAGDYETGGNPGDRRLSIRRDGGLRWVQFGTNRTVVDDVSLTTQVADSRGQSVLVASNHGMIEKKDPLTVVYFGDTYRRKLP